MDREAQNRIPYLFLSVSWSCAVGVGDNILEAYHDLPGVGDLGLIGTVTRNHLSKDHSSRTVELLYNSIKNRS